MLITTKIDERFAHLVRMVAVFSAMVASDAVSAQETDSWMRIGGSIEHSDNIDRIEVGGREETTIGANTEFQIASTGRRYELNAEGILNYSTFRNDTFGDEFRGNAFGELIFNLIGDRLQWLIQDNFGQIRQDVGLPDTPDNRENINVFRTGPKLETRIGPRNTIILAVFYQQSRYEDSLQDSDWLSGFLSFDRTLSPQTNISLNAMARRVEFDEVTVFNNYDLQEIYLGWTSNGARTQLDLEAGYTEIHSLGDVEDGNLFRLLIARDISQRSTLTFDARSELTTTEDAFRFEQQLRRPQLATQGQVADAEPFRLKYVGLAWATAGDRFWAEAGVYGESRDFVRTSANDRDRQGARLALTRAVSERLALGAFAEIGEESFFISTDDFDEMVYGVRMDYLPSRRFQVALTLSRTDRDTDAINLSSTENVVLLTVSYDLFGDSLNRRRQRADR